MASSNSQCKAVAAAMDKSRLSYEQIAREIGGNTTKEHVEGIVKGTTKPTAGEFQALARALKITTPLPNDSAHTA